MYHAEGKRVYLTLTFKERGDEYETEVSFVREYETVADAESYVERSNKEILSWRKVLGAHKERCKQFHKKSKAKEPDE